VGREHLLVTVLGRQSLGALHRFLGFLGELVKSNHCRFS
jgi:hypothetical protein